MHLPLLANPILPPLRGVVVAGAAVWLLAGCGPSREEGFDSATPSGRLQAITEAAHTADASPQTLRELVVSLGSDDPLERMLAIRALEKLTGETQGYRHFDDLASRQEAIDRWLMWLHEQGLAPGTTPGLWEIEASGALLDAAPPTIEEPSDAEHESGASRPAETERITFGS
jgi:hypothetical protein